MLAVSALRAGDSFASWVNYLDLIKGEEYCDHTQEGSAGSSAFRARETSTDRNNNNAARLTSQLGSSYSNDLARVHNRVVNGTLQWKQRSTISISLPT